MYYNSTLVVIPFLKTQSSLAFERNCFVPRVRSTAKYMVRLAFIKGLDLPPLFKLNNMAVTRRTVIYFDILTWNCLAFHARTRAHFYCVKFITGVCLLCSVTIVKLSSLLFI
jgi:hypothetical protein